VSAENRKHASHIVEFRRKVPENTESPLSDGQCIVRELPNGRLLTAKEVADCLGVSERWVRDHATRRFPRIPAVKLGSLLRFHWADVEDFVNSQLLESPSKWPERGV